MSTYTDLVGGQGAHRWDETNQIIDQIKNEKNEREEEEEKGAQKKEERREEDEIARE